MAEYCYECDGRGWGVFSCCGIDITADINETDICPSCGEHCGDEREDCEECDGTGFEKSPIVIENSVMGGTKKIVDEFMGYLDTIFKDRKGNV